MSLRKVDGFLVSNFGGKIVRRAYKLAFAQLEFGKGRCDAKVGEFYGAGLRLENVAGFDIAVSNVEL